MGRFGMLGENTGANAAVYWVRLKLTEGNKTKAINMASDQDILSLLAVGEDFDTNIDNFSEGDFSITTNKSEGYIFVEETSTSGSRSLGVILSRKADTGWLRSSSTMVNLTNTFNYDEALASYLESGEKILNGCNM